MDVTLIRKVAEIKAILAARERMLDSKTFAASMTGDGVLRKYVGQQAFTLELRLRREWRNAKISKVRQKKLLKKWNKYVKENEPRVLKPIFEKVEGLPFDEKTQTKREGVHVDVTVPLADNSLKL